MINRPLIVFLTTLFLLFSGVLKADTVNEDALSIKADSEIGSNIGHFIDQQDRIRILQSLKTGNASNPSIWKSARSGIAYTVTPNGMVESRQKACRDFTLKTALGSFQKVFSGTACRQDNGKWVVLE